MLPIGRDVKLFRLDDMGRPVSLGRGDAFSDSTSTAKTIGSIRRLDVHQLKSDFSVTLFVDDRNGEVGQFSFHNPTALSDRNFLGPGFSLWIDEYETFTPVTNTTLGCTRADTMTDISGGCDSPVGVVET